MKKNTLVNSSINNGVNKEEEIKKKKEEEKVGVKIPQTSTIFFSFPLSSNEMNIEGSSHKICVQIAQNGHQTKTKKKYTKEDQNEQKRNKIRKRIATSIISSHLQLEDQRIPMYCPNPLCRKMQYYADTHVCKYCKGSQIMGENLEGQREQMGIQEGDQGFMEGVKTSNRRFDLEMFPKMGFNNDKLSCLQQASEREQIDFEDGTRIELEILQPLTEQLIEGGYKKFNKRTNTVTKLLMTVEWDDKASDELKQKKMTTLSILAHNKAINAQGGHLIWKDKKSNKWTDTNGMGQMLEKKKDVFFNNTEYKKLGYFRAGMDLATPENEFHYEDKEIQQLSNQEDCMDCKQMDYYKMTCPEDCYRAHFHNYRGGLKWQVNGNIDGAFQTERDRAIHNAETKEARSRKGTITEDQQLWLPRLIQKHGLNADDFNITILSQSQASKTMFGLNVVSRRRINEKNNQTFDETLVETTIKELIKLCGTI